MSIRKGEFNMLSVFQWICRFNFGVFEQEFKKFIRMGAVFALMVGVYWTLRTLKDAVFVQLVDAFQLPFAKTVSVFRAISARYILHSAAREDVARKNAHHFARVLWKRTFVF